MDKRDMILFTRSRLLDVIGSIFLCLFFYSPASSQDISEDILKREIKVRKGQTYLNFPVNNSDRLVRATIKLKGTPLDRFTINLAEKDPSFWVFFDVSSYQGKTLTVEIQNVPQGISGQSQPNPIKPAETALISIKGLNMIFADSMFPGQDSLYMERDRPQVHFSASRGWVNDPNGLIFYNGEYHMFFQHNPYGWQWGNMHWGHAVSKNLIHWQQLNEAIFPVIDESITGRGDAAFSGSAVVDPLNTAGFRRNGIDPLIAIYTSTGRGECLKISYDNGRTFEDYEGNPVLVHNGRDPKVFWYEPDKNWVMVVWNSGLPKKLSTGVEVSIRQHSIYTSPDLKNWTYQSGVSGFFECPELFKIPLEGEPGVSKWVMYDAYGRYIVGDFDGKRFTIEQHFTKYEHGGGYFYASQIFNNSPDGRIIQVGWGRNITHPGMPFNQAELFPSELRLRKTKTGYRLCPTPIPEIRILYKNSMEIKDKILQSGESIGLPVDAEVPLHIIAEFERGDAPITLNILGYELRHDNEWMFATNPPLEQLEKSVKPAGPFPPPTPNAPVIYVPESDIFKIEAIVDKNILEFYVNDGELYYVTEFSGKKAPRIETSISGSSVGRNVNRKLVVRKLEVHELKSIWKD